MDSKISGWRWSGSEITLRRLEASTTRFGLIQTAIYKLAGNPEDVQVTGLSAGLFSDCHVLTKLIVTSGAHSIHQHLHHVTLLPEGVKAPFHTVVLQSNAML